jgi:hypothetical protein
MDRTTNGLQEDSQLSKKLVADSSRIDFSNPDLINLLSNATGFTKSVHDRLLDLSSEELIAAAEQLLDDESFTSEMEHLERDGSSDASRLLSKVSNAISQHLNDHWNPSPEMQHLPSCDGDEPMPRSAIQTDGQNQILDRPQLPNDSKGISGFAKDPYVADSLAGDQTRSCCPPPKTVEEILNTINGYSLENDEELASQVPVEPKSKGLRGPEISAIETVSDPKPLAEVLNDEQLAALTAPMLPGNNESGLELNSPAAATDSGQAHDGATQVEPSVDPFDELCQPEFDVRNFLPDEPDLTEVPAPIRGAFEVDQDLYDHESVAEAEIRSDVESSAEQPVGSMPPDFQAQTAHSAAEKCEISAQTENPFWADCGDTIRIDGEDGYGYIDLACFDVKDARFQPSRIQIACDDGLAFQIEHRNIPHALFAGDVQVELEDGS